MSHSTLPIDAVITWVDGADPAHKAKLDLYFGRSPEARPVGANASRFHDSGEINYCVASLLKFAPWLRTIFILTDAQTPPLMKLIANTAYADKVRVVDHRDIFAGYEDYLPTFNTRSITTMLWRIPGLADNFLYLNDDFVLIQPTEPEYFFQGDQLVLRGNWQTFTEKKLSKKLLKFVQKLLGKPVASTQKRASYVAAIELAAKVLGFDRRYYDLPHNPHPWKKSLLEAFYNENPQLLKKNASYKLRSAEQYVGESLMSHLAIKHDRALLENRFKTLQLKPGEQSITRIQRKLMQADQNPRIIFACIQTLEKAPQNSQELILSWLDKRVGKLEGLVR